MVEHAEKTEKRPRWGQPNAATRTEPTGALFLEDSTDEIILS